MAASTRAEIHFLDAVSTGNAKAAKALLEKDGKQILSKGPFVIAVMALIFHSEDTELMDAFIHLGIKEGAAIGDDTDGRITYGQMAMRVGSPRTLCHLVERGFLTPRFYMQQGLRSPNAETADFWMDLAFDAMKNGGLRKNPNMAEVPQEVFTFSLWAQDMKGRKQNDTTREILRRRGVMLDRYLALAYPAENEEARWQMMMARPATTINVIGASNQVSKIEGLLRHQLAKVPQMLDEPVALNLRPDGWVHTAHALLRCGFSVENFDPDLWQSFCKKLSKAISGTHNLPESMSLLWGAMVESMGRSNPERLAQLPGELTKSNVNLKNLLMHMSAEQRVVLADHLAISASTPAVKREAARPRL